MCIIAICENRALKKSEFDNCWDSNGHGMGFAHWDGTHVVMKKGFMDKVEAWEAYQTAQVPHVVHFRIASAGGINPELTHPFLCERKSTIRKEFTGLIPMLFHNGTVSNWKALLMNAIFATKAIPTGAMSDSRAMAIAVSVLGKELLEMYNDMKWVYVAPTGFTKYGSWVEGEDGILYSNGGYMARSVVVHTSYNGWTPSGSLFGSESESGTEVENRWETAKKKVKERKAAAKHEQQTLSGIKYIRRSCPNCVYWEGNMNCEIKGRMENKIACSEFMEAIDCNKDKKKDNCTKCAFYEGEMMCLEKGRIKDFVACNKYYPDKE